jgi:hypothetical protein
MFCNHFGCGPFAKKLYDAPSFSFLRLILPIFSLSENSCHIPPTNNEEKQLLSKDLQNFMTMATYY